MRQYVIDFSHCLALFTFCEWRLACDSFKIWPCPTTYQYLLCDGTLAHFHKSISGTEFYLILPYFTMYHMYIPRWYCILPFLESHIACCRHLCLDTSSLASYSLPHIWEKKRGLTGVLILFWSGWLLTLLWCHVHMGGCVCKCLCLCVCICACVCVSIFVALLFQYKVKVKTAQMWWYLGITILCIHTPLPLWLCVFAPLVYAQEN